MSPGPRVTDVNDKIDIIVLDDALPVQICPWCSLISMSEAARKRTKTAVPEGHGYPPTHLRPNEV